MEESLLNRFLKLMSTSISDSDLELIQLGHSLGLNLVSFAELRASQENSFIDLIRTRALEKMEKDNDNFLINNNSFFAGSIDFMVSDEPEGKKFFLLETNGGSHRGLSIISKKQQQLLFNGYLEAINQAIKLNKHDDDKLFVLVGVPVNDALIHEKVIMDYVSFSNFFSFLKGLCVYRITDELKAFLFGIYVIDPSKSINFRLFNVISFTTPSIPFVSTKSPASKPSDDKSITPEAILLIIF